MELGDSEETLLGFDAREMELTGLRVSEPDGGRPTQFLLRTDLEDVLSADTMVWPSIVSADIPQPELVGMNAPFWEDLGALRKATAQSDQNLFYLIAATWHSDVGFEEEARQEGVERSRQQS